MVFLSEFRSFVFNNMHGSTHSFNPFSVFLSGADSFGQFVRSCWLLGGRFPLLRLTTLATMGGSYIAVLAICAPTSQLLD